MAATTSSVDTVDPVCGRVFHIPAEPVSSQTPIADVASLLEQDWLDGPVERGPSFVGPTPAERRHAVAAEALAGLSGERNAVDARISAVIAAVVERETWNVNGVRSPAHWIAWQLGVTPTEVKRWLTVAEARQTHPQLSALFDEGKLSLAQMAVAVRVHRGRDGEVAELAPLCTVSQLRTITAAMISTDTVEPPPTDNGDSGDNDGDSADDEPAQPSPAPPAPPAPRDEFLDLFPDDDGSLLGKFGLNPEPAQLFRAALWQARDRLYHQRNGDAGAGDGDGDGERKRVSWVEAFVEMCNRSMDAETSPSRRDRFRINVFIDPTSDVRATWEDRGGVPGWLADKLTCDGTVSPVFVNDSKPVSVGRRQRTVPDRTRRLVMWRDGHTCRVPWCTNSQWLDVHHIVHWANGGGTDSGNLMAICSACHSATHQGEFSIAGDADNPIGLRFTNRHGLDLSPPEPKPPPGPPPGMHRYRHPLGEQLRKSDIFITPQRAKRN